MIESGFITEAQAAEALRQKTSTRVARDDIAPHFADWILAQVRDYLGDIDTDLRVVTTIDPSLQRIANDELAAVLEAAGATRKDGPAALVRIAPHGEVRALGGARASGHRPLRRDTTVLRPQAKGNTQGEEKRK